MERDQNTGRFVQVGPELVNINIKVPKQLKADLVAKARERGITLTDLILEKIVP